VKLTKGHFEAIAATLRAVKPTYRGEGGNSPQAAELKQWSETVRAMAELCHESSNFTGNGNRAFDLERFLKACGAK
jgi:uncharacterized protein YukE